MALLGQALLEPVCERLINTAFEEYALVRGVKGEIQKLRSTVGIILAVLRDAEGKQVGSELVTTWLSSLKQTVFDAEDVLDEVTTDAALRRRDRRLVWTNDVGAKVRNIICCFGTVHNLLADHGIAHRIKHIREMLHAQSNEISTVGLERLGVGSVSDFIRPRRLQTSSLPTDGGDVIGRDDEKKSLEELLLLGCADGTEGTSSSSSNNNVHVITVTGMGGVGKTTLVKLVYNSPRVQQHFHPTLIWVCVSNDFDLERIRREIMEAIPSSDKVEEPCNITNWDQTQIRIKGKIEGKRFLLVLDDMWEENDHAKWESLCEPLRYGGKGSKIVVTARSQKVSHMVRGTHIPLAILSSGNLQSLFERFAFEGCDPNKRTQLEPVGRQIAEKLKGLPLAAKIVGRLLNARLDVMYWQSVLRSERWVQPRDPNDILPVLKLSYDQLPGHLKQCFAYCSLFPKDYSFSKDELVQLWTAQNFIHVPKGSHADQSDMNENFDDLLHASFFEKSKKRFVMHDLIHDLAESVSEDDSFKLVQNDRNERIPETVRHVSIVTKRFDPTRLDELCKLRTLLFLHSVDLNLHLDALFMKFKRLRVLSLRGCEIEELPKSIGTLKHLRYVDLSSTDITMLPNSICNLHNLQVLRLGGCRSLGSLPRNMSALVNLSHLEVDDDELVSTIQHLGKLTALRELIVAGGKLKELENMGMLRQLRIRRLEEVTSKEEALQARLEDKVHLDVLELRWSDNRPYRDPSLLCDQEVADALQPVNSSIRELLVINYGGISSPRWMEGPSWASASTSFQLLQRVVLDDCKNWEVLPPLGQLPCLKFLKIRGMSAVTRIGPQFYGGGGGVRVQPGFPSLEMLEFWNMAEWEGWEAPPHQQPLLLPRLRELGFWGCMKLKELPPLPPTLDALQIMSVGLTHLPGWTPSAWSSSPSLSSLYIHGCRNLTSLGNGLLQQPLPTLKFLSVSRCPELASLPDTPFRHLTSLEELRINDCPKLSHLGIDVGSPDADDDDTVLSTCLRGLTSSLKYLTISDCSAITTLAASSSEEEVRRRLTALEELRIGKCPKLLHLGHVSPKTLRIGSSSPEQITMWLRQCPSLEELRIEDCPQLTCIDGELEMALLDLAPSLRILGFWFCENLRVLPAMSRNLSSLGRLVIFKCPKIESLPSAGLPESLDYLSIGGCPELVGRCKEEGCPDWPLLSHIRKVVVTEDE